MADGDEGVIQAVLAGDVDRYAELVDRYQRQARQVAYGLLGNAADADDASQDAFVSAYRALRRFRRGAKFSTWLYRIVVNKCRDVYRRRARSPHVAGRIGSEPATPEDASFFVDVADPAGTPSDQTANRELAEQLSTAIGALPMKQRTVVVLHHLQGMSLDEVADVMACRLGTVKSHAHRAMVHLRERLRPWVEPEAP